MLVTDPKERASLSEIMNHPWMTKGYAGSPDNYLHSREPLQLPLDPKVVEKMTGFDFGSERYITEQLTNILESEDYQTAVRRSIREDSSSNKEEERKRGVFGFYKRRNSVSREGITSPSMDAIRGLDPTNSYSPLISVYYLVREKIERERKEANPGALAMPQSAGEKPLKLPDLPAPEAAHTNQHAYEIPGEKATGGRSRPRARTHGDDEVTEGMKRVNLGTGARTGPTSPAIVEPTAEHAPRKESTAGALLRRLSTRRTREHPPTPSVNIQPPGDLASPPRKSFSVRRSRQHEPLPTTLHPGGSQPQQDYLNVKDLPPTSRSKGLGRSTSVNSADYRPRRLAGRGVSDSLDAGRPADAPTTSGSDRSSTNEQKSKTIEFSDQSAPHTPPLSATKPPPAAASRTKSLGHARRESIQARRQRREERDREANVPEETDAELRANDERLSVPETPGADIPKPVYLKGLFSVSTTSSKPLPVIRQDIIRVLRQLGVDYEEIKGGFNCRHAPSIDLDRVREPMSPMGAEEEKSGRVMSGHQRKISFGGFRNRDRDDFREDAGKMRRAASQRRPPDRSFVTNSEGSDEYVHSGVPPRISGDIERDMAATTTRVQSDTGENMVLKFEIFIVKVPLFSLHGIQFKKVQGGMLQYRNMAKKILEELRL